MKKDANDKIEELEDWRAQKEIEDGIRNGIEKYKKEQGKRMHYVCMTATSAIMTVFYNIGQWAANHMQAIGLAIDAFIAAMKGGK